MKTQPTKERTIDIYFAKYNEYHTNPVNRIINYICIPVITFSVIGFIWSLPFININFLGVKAGFLNWASFLIAFSIYYYYRMSPILSYCMLLVVFAFAYGIVQLEYWQKAGGMVLPQVCIVLFVIANFLQLIGYKLEGKKPMLFFDFKFLLISSLWLLSLILKRFGIKY
jgi:uncharacterized membrane protein YGL010W